MTNATEQAGRTAHQYLAAWNERDPDRRRAMIVQGWAEDARYVDPMMQGAGHAEIDAMIAAVQERFPGFRFALHGTPDGHGDRVRFSWSLGPVDAEPLAIGTDFVQLAPDGRIGSVTGFLDQLQAAA
ncbi:nuclear transport factor 2 family protein [Azospirillum rugosum]|uniref:SnoaL-like domain-containing protein n=1 Tax=Azospirillum rugosum TaxID=416170 RepID=A0ABS4SW86_9PROT|nr:nuclear transport factor 2 family protein [Azospirillum rugosum]MBP2296494.1 hypothetical protein [Azospirillum rugosum]MDQ0530015.1 hypothetical protein [Azospirillum rugosum]